MMGVGDPLDRGGELPVWVTGEGDDAIATLARPVALGNGVTALLIHQSAGTEQVKRLHQLFVAAGGRLVGAWSSGSEGQGFTSSTVDTMDVDRDGHVEVLLWRFASPDAQANDWELSVHRWNAGQARMENVPESAGPPVFAAIATTFPTPAAAGQFLVDHSECQGRFLVIRSPGRDTPTFAVAGLTARRPLAEQAARECPRGGGGRVVDLGARRR